MVRRVFGLYLLRSINEELRDLRSLSLYYRLLRSWFSSFSRRYKDKHFSDLSRTGFFELALRRRPGFERSNVPD